MPESNHQNDQEVLQTLKSLSKEDIKNLFPGASYSLQIYQPALSLLDLAMKIQKFKNDKEAQDVIHAGGFYVNQIKRTNIDEMIVPGDHILSNDCSVIRIGRRKASGTLNQFDWNSSDLSRLCVFYFN